MKILTVIGEKGKATAREIHRRVQNDPVPRSVVLSKLLHMVESGYLEIVDSYTEDTKISLFKLKE